jgi:hypothetical protein
MAGKAEGPDSRLNGGGRGTGQRSDKRTTRNPTRRNTSRSTEQHAQAPLSATGFRMGFRPVLQTNTTTAVDKVDTRWTVTVDVHHTVSPIVCLSEWHHVRPNWERAAGATDSAAARVRR